MTKLNDHDITETPISATDAPKRTKKPQKAVTLEEAEYRAATLQTQGRRGCKAARITMAFTPANHDFIRIVSKATGKSMTRLVNDIIAAYREENPKVEKSAKALLNTVNSSLGEGSRSRKGEK